MSPADGEPTAMQAVDAGTSAAQDSPVTGARVTPDAVPGAPAAGTADADQAPTTPSPAPRRRLRWLWATLAGIAAAALVVVTAYMVVVTNGWREYASDLEASLEEVKAVAAQDRADRDAMEERLAVVESQLETANARITDLANEEANALDSQAALRDAVEAMIECADWRQEIIRVLTNPSLYFRQGTNAVRAEVDAFCQEVQTSYYEKLAGE